MRRTMLHFTAAVLLVNIVVPKAGFKVGDIPITVGNILYLALLALGVLALAGRHRVPPTPLNKVVAILTVYMAARTAATLLTGSFDFGFAFSLVLAPLVFYAIVASARESDDVALLARIYVVGFAVLALYSAAQYLFGVDAVAISGITVNVADYQGGSDWYLRKDNRVGETYKLFATYQNGNLYGVNLLLIFGIAHEAMRGWWRTLALGAFLVIGLLTLSRSVWLGIAVYLLLRFVLTRAATLAGAAGRLALGVGLLASIPLLFGFLPQLTDRFFQSSSLDSLLLASGRTPRMLALIDSTSGNPLAILVGPYGIFTYEGNAFEITYGAIYMVGGVIALALFVAALLIAWRTLRHSPSEIARGAWYGVGAYAVASLVEGAFWLPPTALIMWATIGVGFAAHRAAVGDPWPDLTNVRPRRRRGGRRMSTAARPSRRRTASRVARSGR